MILQWRTVNLGTLRLQGTMLGEDYVALDEDSCESRMSEKIAYVGTGRSFHLLKLASCILPNEVGGAKQQLSSSGQEIASPNIIRAQ